VEANRGNKKGKKPWQMRLGVKEAVFASLGVLGLMMMAFAMGTLAGRGDIYRVFYNWGLLAPGGSKVAPYLPGAGPPAPGGQAPAAGAPAAAPTAPTTVAPPTPASTKGAPQTPVTGSIAGSPTSTASGKKSKGGSTLHREQKAKEEELRKARQDVAKKLKFQNSFDTAGKPQKGKDKSKAQPSLVRVAQFRDSKAAQAKLAELQKKGIKATLKEGNDAKGPVYTVYKPAPAPQSEAEHVAQKPQKASDKKAKSQEE
jgi:hypothetical protein